MAARSSAATEITIRDCDSLKSAVVAGVSPAFNRISAPNSRSGFKQHSASATASPPSEQSCALLTRPAWIRSRMEFCTFISCVRSMRGAGPIFNPWHTFR